jgi:hypothetical protein
MGTTYKYKRWHREYDDGGDTIEWRVEQNGTDHVRRFFIVKLDGLDDDCEDPGDWSCSCAAFDTGEKAVRCKWIGRPRLDCIHIRMIKRTEQPLSGMMVDFGGQPAGPSVDLMHDGDLFVCDDCAGVFPNMGFAHKCMTYTGDRYHRPAEHKTFRLVSRKVKGEPKVQPVVEHVLLVQPVKRAIAIRPRSGVPHG